MKTLILKLDDTFADEVEHFRKTDGYASKSPSGTAHLCVFRIFEQALPQPLVDKLTP